MSNRIAVRAARPGDGPAIAELAVATGLLSLEEASGMASSLGDAPGDTNWLTAVDPVGSIVGATFAGREPVSDRVWNLYFMAVAPAHHGRGVGTLLLGDVERQLRTWAERPATALVIETSSLASFAGTRAFYAGRGYRKVGEVPDYYGPGDAKVIFWKSLIGGDGEHG
jgi:GNAT superfamily N-acetyltransferase